MPPSAKTFSVIGVDLAAQPENTAYCKIVVSPEGGMHMCEAKTKVGDKDLLCVFKHADRIAIDAPFGWPINFAAAVCMHGLSNRWPHHDPKVYPGERSKNKYRDLKYRSTDLHVWKRVCQPLSVVTDWISYLAIRNAGLLARAESEDWLKVDRSGASGRFLEVYPAAAFARWNIDTTREIPEAKKPQSYRKDSQVCKQVAQDVLDRFPALGGAKHITEANHNAVDALASALVALMAELDGGSGRFIEPIPAGMEAVAKREGWIALPKQDSLDDLTSGLRALLK